MRKITILTAIALLIGAIASGCSPQVRPSAAAAPVTPQPTLPTPTVTSVVGGRYVTGDNAPWAVEITLYGTIPVDYIKHDKLEERRHNTATLLLDDRPDWDIRHLCGAVLIAQNWVLTAAHCVVGAPGQEQTVKTFKQTSRLRIGTLDIDGQSGSLCAPLDVRFPPDGDVALIRINRARCKNTANPGHAVPIRILGSAPGDHDRSTFDNTTGLTVLGWGMTLARPDGALRESTSRIALHDDRAHLDPDSVYLKYADISYVPPQTCAQTKGYARLVADGMLCAGVIEGLVDQCDGDSGGPLTMNVWLPGSVLERLLVGIVHGSAGCGQPATPGAYEYVPKYLAWIETTIAPDGNPATGRALLAAPAAGGP